MLSHELTRGRKPIATEVLVDCNRLCVVHIMDGMDIRWEYFVRGNEALYLHAERGALALLNIHVAPNGVVEVRVRCMNIHTICAAVGSLPV